MYGKSGMNWRPTTSDEAKGRNALSRLHDKLIAIRNGKKASGRSATIRGASKGVVSMTDDVILSIAFAAEKGQLRMSAQSLFERLTRAEILCWLLQQVSYTYQSNKERYGYKEEKRKDMFGPKLRSEVLLNNIYRLTREEVTELYGAEDYFSHYRVNGRVYDSDVDYGKFLREHGLGYRYGGNIIESDREPLDLSVMFGTNVFARATTMRGLANMTV